MKQEMSALPMRIDRLGVTFHAVDWGGLNVAHVHLPKDADAAPLLEGMPQNLCQCPHWGIVLRGSVHVRFADGREELVREGEVYHWPAGHTVWTDEEYDAIEFSPTEPMNEVLDHLAAKLDGSER